MLWEEFFTGSKADYIGSPHHLTEPFLSLFSSTGSEERQKEQEKKRGWKGGRKEIGS